MKKSTPSLHGDFPAQVGDVCKLAGEEGLWALYASVGCVKTSEYIPHQRWRFAKYPNHDALRSLPLTDVLEVVHAAGSAKSAGFWAEHLVNLA